jgi:hypothetical protein
MPPKGVMVRFPAFADMVLVCRRPRDDHALLEAKSETPKISSDIETFLLLGSSLFT